MSNKISELYPNLYFTRYRFSLAALEEIALPEFKGSTFRGSFGWALKKSTGPLWQLFEYTFNSPAEVNIPFELKGVKAMPHPYILVPPIFHKRRLSKDELFEIELILIGPLVNYLEYFSSAVMLMGQNGLASERGKFRLLNILSIDSYGSKHLIFEEQKGVLQKNDTRIFLKDILSLGKIPSKVKLTFETPFLIQSGGKEIISADKDSISPQLLSDSLERRVRHLAVLYGKAPDNKQDIDSSELTISSKLEKVNVIRKRTGKDYNEDFYGLMGEIMLEGNLEILYPYIKAGEYLHLGKKTSFGFGKYKIYAD
jgi:CRISPR-associated endoribonuclease Cas6